MKTPLVLPLVALILAGCNKTDPNVAKKLAELEDQNRIAVEHQHALERQLTEQHLAAERDAIERERQRIEDERLTLEQDQSAEATAKQAALAEREQALARREGRLVGFETTIVEQQRDLDYRDDLISGRELELAGREPLVVTEEPAQALPVGDYGMFYDALAAYGSWLETSGYGYVWQPAVVVQNGWRPYYNGRWACTNRGWTWLSDEPFGWACYHYGRWALLHGRGWVWVPGDQWAPAWVCWRENGSHIGWAPLPPETLGWRDCHWDNTIETRFGIGVGWFNFVETAHFGGPIRGHCLPLAENATCHRQTVNTTNILCHDRDVFVGGPDYQDLCRNAGRPLSYYRLNLDRQQRPGHDLMAMRPRVDGGRLHVAAPEVGTGWNATLRPTKVREQLHEVAIDRPVPLDAGVASQFSRHRELERAQAEQEVNRLGGLAAFNRSHTRELEANQRAAAARTKPPDTRSTPDRPTRPYNQPIAVQSPPGTVDPISTRSGVGQQPAPAMPESVQAVSQRATEEARQRDEAVLKEQRQRAYERNAAALAAQQEQLAALKLQQEATRSKQAEAANRQREQETTARESQAALRAKLAEARQQHPEIANKQPEPAAAAHPQLASEPARENQSAALSTQQAVRQRQAEEARIRQQETLRTQQAASQRQAEEARARQQESLRTQQAARTRQQAPTRRQTATPVMPSPVSPLPSAGSSPAMPTGGSPAPSRVSPRPASPASTIPASPDRSSPRAVPGRSMAG